MQKFLIGNISSLQSSAEILDNYGYHRDGIKRLYCTISATAPNPQGLQFYVDDLKDWLIEQHHGTSVVDVATWDIDILRKTTSGESTGRRFWVEAREKIISGSQHYHYISVIHTKNPMASHLGILLKQGTITMDHAIKRNMQGRYVRRDLCLK